MVKNCGVRIKTHCIPRGLGLFHSSEYVDTLPELSCPRVEVFLVPESCWFINAVTPIQTLALPITADFGRTLAGKRHELNTVNAELNVVGVLR
jgi:hypothetical protein